MRLLHALALLAGFCLAIEGQTAVEHSLVTAGGTAAAAASSKNAGKSVGAVFGTVSKILDKAAKPATEAAPGNSREVISVPAPANAAHGKSKPAAEDAAGITVGLHRQELLQRFGEPSLKTADDDNGRLIETWLYPSAKRDSIAVTLRDGEVTAVSAGQKPQKTAVVMLQ